MDTIFLIYIIEKNVEYLKIIAARMQAIAKNESSSHVADSTEGNTS